jgi:hypothetical protein
MEIKTHLLKWKLCFSLAAIILLASCNKQNADTNTVYLPVVEGYLLPGHSITVKLYQQKALTDTALYGAPITGLQVYVSDGSTSVQLTEASKGTYTYNNQNFLVAGKTYSLNFKYLTSTVSAKTLMPSKPTNFTSQYGTLYISSTSGTANNTTTINMLSWDNPDTLNHVLVFNNPDGAAFPLRSFRNSPSPNFEVNTNRTSFYNITENTFPYYGHYQVILLRVNQEYINLMNSNTSSSTSQTLSNVTTNIVNGFGIFTAMQADTVSLNVLD